MTGHQLLDLPHELLVAIINQTDEVSDSVNFGLVCRRLYSLATISDVWRWYCRAAWYDWSEQYEIDIKLGHKPLQTDWHALYLERAKTDHRNGQVFEGLLATQQARASQMHELAKLGLEVRDFITRQYLKTADDADDVLTRRWHAETILQMMARRQAVYTWGQLQRGEHVELEEALSACDDFVLGAPTREQDTRPALDALAAAIRAAPAGFAAMATRQKAVAIAVHLRSRGVVGLPPAADDYALRNHFLSLALRASARGEPRGCGPLQSVAIFCAVARRLGVDAQPAKTPGHVYAIVTAPAGMTLDGELRMAHAAFGPTPETMHMDPFHQDGEVDEYDLHRHLSQMGIPRDQWDALLGPASVPEMVRQTMDNILLSVKRLHVPGVGLLAPAEDLDPHHPDPVIAQYAALWSVLIFGSDGDDSMLSRSRRIYALQCILAKFASATCQDMDMFVETAPRLLLANPFLPRSLAVTQDIITLHRAARVPVPRPADGTDPVQHRVGTYFKHRRYGYRGFIVGWSPTCAAAASWIAQMRIKDLPRGRNQPFYHICF